MRGMFAHRARLGRGPGEDRRRPQRPADRRRPRRGRVLRRLRHPRDPEPHARRGVPRRRGDGGHHAVGRRVHRLQRARGLEDDAARAVGSDRGGEGRPQALHAQGDLRAADRRARHDPRPRLARPRPDLPRGPEHLGRDASARSQKVTIIACGTSWHAGAGRQVPDRGAGAGSGRSRLRLRVPLPQPDRRAATSWRSSSRSRARPPTRWRRCARRKRKGASSIAICNVVGSMATREADGTVYTHAGPEIGVASTKAFTSQLVALQLLALYLAQVRGTLDAGRDPPPHRGAAAAAADHRAGASRRPRRSRRSPSGSTTAPTSCSWAAASTTRSRSKAR